MDVALTSRKRLLDAGAQPVTSGNLFKDGLEDNEGLLSPAIFGVTTDEKAIKIGYIDLPVKMIHPLVYMRIFQRSFRKIDQIIRGTTKFKVDNGKLVEDEDGGTGIFWLYSVIDDLDIYKGISKEEDSVIALKLKEFMQASDKRDLFITAYPVTRLADRDVSVSDDGVTGIDEINELYRELIGNCTYYTNNKDSVFVDSNIVIHRIQMSLCKIFEYYEERVFKKFGIQRKGMMSRHTDYGSRLVVSAPPYAPETFGESWLSDMDTVGIPLSSVVANCIFKVLYHSVSVLERIHMDGGFEYKGESLPLEDVIHEHFDTEHIKDLVTYYGKSVNQRGEHLLIPNTKEPIRIRIEMDGKEEFKPLTITEFLYLCAYEIIEEETNYSLLTRYPAQGEFSIIALKVRILSTDKTKKVKLFGNLEIPFFPDMSEIEKLTEQMMDKTLTTAQKVRIGNRVAPHFLETMVMSNLLCAGFNMDYDGDMLASRILMSEEANAESRDYLNSHTSVFLLNGTNYRDVGGREVINGLYGITKDPIKGLKEIPTDVIEKFMSLKNKELLEYFKELTLDTVKKNSDYKPNSPVDVVIRGKNYRTTLGRVFFWKHCCEHLDDMYFFDWVMDKKGYSKAVDTLAEWCIQSEDNKVKEFKYFLIRSEEIGFVCSRYFGPPIDMRTFGVTPEYREYRKQLIEENKERIEAGDLIVYEEVEGKLSKKFVDECDKAGINLEQYHNGAKMKIGTEARVGNMATGPMPVGINASDYVISTSCYVEGIPKTEFSKFAKSMVISGYFRAMAPADGGTIGKEIQAAVHRFKLQEKGSDCKTKRYITINCNDFLTKELIGRYIIEGGKELKLTKENIGNYKGKDVNLRSAITCQAPPDYCCNKCAGDTPYLIDREGEIEIGKRATKIGDEITQAALSKFHQNKVVMKMIDIMDYLVYPEQEVKEFREYADEDPESVSQDDLATILEEVDLETDKMILEVLSEDLSIPAEERAEYLLLLEISECESIIFSDEYKSELLLEEESPPYNPPTEIEDFINEVADVKKGEWKPDDYKKKQRAIGLVIRNEKGEVLLLNHNKIGKWTIPVGKLDKGEKIEDAVIREAREELGINIKKMVRFEDRPEKQVFYRDEILVNIDLYIYEITDYSGTITNKEPHKHKDMKFINPTKVIDMYITDTTDRLAHLMIADIEEAVLEILEGPKPKPDKAKIKLALKKKAAIDKTRAKYDSSFKDALKEGSLLKAQNRNAIGQIVAREKLILDKQRSADKAAFKAKLLAKLGPILEKWEIKALGKQKKKLDKIKNKLLVVLAKKNAKIDAKVEKKIDKVKDKMAGAIAKSSAKFTS